MQINEVIHKLRTKQGLTQEQMANYLGVSAPAVNKWERGVTYPDITILPSLARLLDTDLNTLLSFQDELTTKEINVFTEELVSLAKEKGIRTAFERAKKKILEYPNCHELILSVALTLEGLYSMFSLPNEADLLPAEIEGFYERAAQSEIPKISSTAKSMLISKYMNQKEYVKAKTLLDTLPDPISTDKKRLETKLFMCLENYEEAAKSIEQRLLVETNDIYSDLIRLMEIALKQNRVNDAKYIAEVTKRFSQLFDQWEYNSYVPEFELAMTMKDASACVLVLKKLLPALLVKWDYTKSILYQHLEQKEEKKENLGTLILPKILEELKDPDHLEYAFLQNTKEFQTLLASYDSLG